MSQPRILLVDYNERRAFALRNALANSNLAQPVIRHDGESAVLWVGANECDICIISYELPGINGLEALARIRNRRPGASVIIFAETGDQAIAIAAFREGVDDFVPARGRFETVISEKVAELAGRSVRPSGAPASTLDDPTLYHIPPDRLAPSYQNRLRTIGRQLDLYGYHSISIIEVEGGYLVRALQQRGCRPEALEFPDKDFPRLVASAIHQESEKDATKVDQSELIPTGYEDFLRALGYRLDSIMAESIVITELADTVVVGGRGNDERSAIPGLTPLSIFLEQGDIEFMLNEAFRRRGQAAPKIAKPAQKHGGLRGILRRLN